MDDKLITGKHIIGWPREMTLPISSTVVRHLENSVQFLTPQHERHGHNGMSPERAVDTITRESVVHKEASRTEIV